MTEDEVLRDIGRFYIGMPNHLMLDTAVGALNNALTLAYPCRREIVSGKLTVRMAAAYKRALSRHRDLNARHWNEK